MEKILYISRMNNRNVNYDIHVSFDKSEAISIALEDRFHRSSSERNQSYHYVIGLSFDIPDDYSPYQAYFELFDEIDYRNNVYYEEWSNG